MFISPSAPKSNTVTFQRYHKINMQSLRCDLAKCSFVASPGNTVNALYEQYTRDLSGLLDKHNPMVSQTFIKRPLIGFLTPTYKLKRSVTSSNGSGTKTSLHKIGLDSTPDCLVQATDHQGQIQLLEKSNQ